MELSNPLISEYTWANKPSVAPLGQIICVTDVGENGSLWRGNGTKWVRLSQILFYDLTAAFAITGTTLETTLVTLTIPAGLIGSNGKVKFYPLWSTTNNANTKTLRVKFPVGAVYTAAASNIFHVAGLVIIRNFGSESVQRVSSGMLAGLGGTISSIAQTTIDTSAATTITITGQLAVGTDTMTLEGLFVEIV
jgi:hypothetical protein